MVELRGHGHKEGFIEICGKDEYGVYAALDQWLTSKWGCVKLDAGDLSADTMVPFCDALYEWKGFKMMGETRVRTILVYSPRRSATRSSVFCQVGALSRSME